MQDQSHQEPDLLTLIEGERRPGLFFFSSRLLVLLGKLTVFQSEADSRDTDTVRL